MAITIFNKIFSLKFNKLLFFCTNGKVSTWNSSLTYYQNFKKITSNQLLTNKSFIYNLYKNVKHNKWFLNANIFKN